MSDQRFPKSCRLLKPAEFERVFASGTYAADGVLVVSAAANATGATRLGLSVSRKVGPAVVRNRWKRLIREAFRRSRQELPPGLDLVVRPKRGAEPAFAAVAASLPALAARVSRKVESGVRRQESGDRRQESAERGQEQE